MNAHLQGQMHTIGRRYIARTLKEMDGLRRTIDDLKAGEAEKLSGVVQAVHRISGSAAVFGFHQVSECASRIERLVAMLDNDHDPEATITAIDTLAIELDRAVRSAAFSRGVR